MNSISPDPLFHFSCPRSRSLAEPTSLLDEPHSASKVQPVPIAEKQNEDFQIQWASIKAEIVGQDSFNAVGVSATFGTEVEFDLT